MIELVSGVASCMPGIGTYASYAISAGLFISDVKDKIDEPKGEIV